MKIGVVARCRDEDKIVCDWVRHYKNLNFDKIWIYDFASKIPVKTILRSKNLYYGDDLEVIRDDNRLVDFPGCCIKENLDKYLAVDWLLHVDIDEFLFVQNGFNVKKYLGLFKEHHVDIITINWLTFGTSNKNTYDYSKTLFQQFTYREPYNSFWNNFVKSFIRTEFLYKEKEKEGNIPPHIPITWGSGNKDVVIYDCMVNKLNIDVPSTSSINGKYPSSDSLAYIVHYMTLDFESMSKKREKYHSANINIGKRYTKEWYFGKVDPAQKFTDSVKDERFINL